jgi:protein MPE1
LPAIKKGAGKASRYITGKMPVNAKNSSRKEQANKAKPAASTNGITQMNSSMTEEQRMAAMFQSQQEQWSAQQEEMAK